MDAHRRPLVPEQNPIGLFGSGIAAEDAVICQTPEIAQASHGWGGAPSTAGMALSASSPVLGVLEVSMS